jgi:DNA-directed RNA polymerase sigma subunit (sigma70/sigma32)
MRRPSTEEVAKEVGIPALDVEYILSLANGIVSLDAETGDDTGSLIDLCEDFTYSPDREVIRESVREETLNFLERLLEREKRILMYRFQFYGRRALHAQAHRRGDGYFSLKPSADRNARHPQAPREASDSRTT